LPPTPAPHSPTAAALRELEQIERSFGLGADGAGARERAERLLAAFGEQERDAGDVVQAFAAELLVALARDRPEAIEGALAKLDGLRSVTRLGLAREAFRSPDLAALPPAAAVELELSLLAVLARLKEVSLWVRDPAGQVRLVQRLGPGQPSSVVRALARRLVAGDGDRAGPRAELFGVAVQRLGQPVGALVLRVEPARRERCRALVGEILPALTAALERDALMARSAASERALVQAGERRLTRLGFDLHDGPLQELLLLAGDLRLFREQLAIVLEGRRGKELLGGRLDDLDARLVALERALRRISTSTHASVLVSRPLGDALDGLVEAFSKRTGIRPRVRLQGDLERISPSQRITLLSVIGEALNNIREHSAAATVEISLSCGPREVRAGVRDDGRGFDVERALVGAARRGRMGLAGVHERVRLLGGQCRIESSPGGPTAIALTLPCWEPLAAVGGDREGARRAPAEQRADGARRRSTSSGARVRAGARARR
jgi:signal transduction histidine kinase